MNEAPTHVVYHFPCFDGFTAAWLFWRAFPSEDITFIGANYGDALPDFPSSARVVVVDVSWPRAELEDLAGRVASLVVLDHHKTAQEELEGLDFAVFDMERSGAGLAWDHLHGDGERYTVNPAEKLLVDYVQDRDLWRFDMAAETRMVHAYLSSLPWDFDAWTDAARMLRDDPDSLYERGFTVLEYQNRRVTELQEGFRPVLIPGAAAVAVLPAVNIGVRNLISETLKHALELNPEWPVAAAWFMRPDGVYEWSLRGQRGVDCSEWAEPFGGGGHFGAAGFRTTMAPVKAHEKDIGWFQDLSDYERMSQEASQ